MEAAAVVTPAAIGGLLFAPAFSLRTLVLPVLLAAAVVLVADRLVRVRQSLTGWRTALSLAAGALVLSELLLRPTLAGGMLPTASTVRAFADAVVHGWRRTLETSWPAPADTRLVLGVPVIVLLAATAATEIVQRSRRALLALAPGLAVVLLSQTFAAADGVAALGAGLGCAAAAAVLFAIDTSGRHAVPGRTGLARRRRPTRSHLLTTLGAAVLALLVAAGAAGALLADPAGRTPVALDRPAPASRPAVVTSPLDEIGERLSDPGQVVFTDRPSTPVDRWTLAVFDRFDGANWTASPALQRLGSSLPPAPGVTVQQRDGSARVSLIGLPSVWLPTQDRTRAVAGASPLVDPSTGVLVSDGDIRDYTLSWSSPIVSAQQLGTAALSGERTQDLGEVPAGFADLAAKAVGDGPPSFRAALLLESYLRKNYRTSPGPDLPTGHGYPQLEHFLTVSRQGTSEQFASAYVVLARLLGIPARLAVGFRQPSAPGPDGGYTVTNADVFAWPEVPVTGVGWVPLDPTGTARASGGAGAAGGLVAATQQARDALPPPSASSKPDRQQDRTDDAADDVAAADSWTSRALKLAALAVMALVVLAVLLLAAVPVAKGVRRRRRRRRPATRSGVLGAWQEARDRLRDFGIVASRSMTVRDLADSSGVPGLDRLAACLDRALWSPELVFDDVAVQAWKAVDQVRDGLRARPWRSRVRAAVDPRSLLAPPPVGDPAVQLLADLADGRATRPAATAELVGARR